MLVSPPDSLARLRVVFVDDEINVLDGLRRSMHSMRQDWDMQFANSGAEALAMMREATPDIVISDMRMPGLSGRDVLLEVKRHYPRAVRFILSGYAEKESVMQVAGVAHQYLSKPCQIDVLKIAISRALALRQLLENRALIEVIGNVDSLPSLPSMYQRILTCLQGADPAVADVAHIINSDMVMTTMVLKLANSAFFGAAQTFRTADRAVAFLGLNTISGLVLAHSLFTGSTPALRPGFSLDKLWHHSLQTATCARLVAQYEKWTPDRVEEAFLAGILHDLGKLVLAYRGIPGEWDDAPQDSSHSSTPNDAHAEAGAYLLGLWGFADTLIEAIAFHHHPSSSAGPFSLPGLLHVSDKMVRFAEAEGDRAGGPSFEVGYLESIGFVDHVPGWQASLAACTRAA